MNCMSIMLPNIAQASFEDILELRLKAKDELLELRYYLDYIVSQIKPTNFNEDICTKIIATQINPAIKNLEHKFKDIKLNVVQKFLAEIKNPLSYAPFIATIFTDIPSHIMLIASLTGIGLSTATEYYKKKNELEENSLFFLLKLRDRL